MEFSLFLARFLGLYLLIVGAALLIRRDQIPSIVREFFHNPALILLSGIFALTFGLVIVLAHTTWEASWRGLITALGYLAVLKGTLRLWIPDRLQQFVVQRVGPRYVTISAIVMMLLGIFLIHHGFLAQHS